jgi:hypothetical protein
MQAATPVRSLALWLPKSSSTLNQLMRLLSRHGGAGCGVAGASGVEKQAVAAEKSIPSEPRDAAVSEKKHCQKPW